MGGCLEGPFQCLHHAQCSLSVPQFVRTSVVSRTEVLERLGPIQPDVAEVVQAEDDQAVPLHGEKRLLSKRLLSAGCARRKGSGGRRAGDSEGGGEAFLVHLDACVEADGDQEDRNLPAAAARCTAMPL